MHPGDFNSDGLTAPLPPRSLSAPLIISGAVLVILGIGGLLYLRASAGSNKVALVSTPKGVTVVEARATPYRATRRYVGTIEPWVQARLGPQYVSAYVDTVLVRPGMLVKRGQVVATLDCRNASAESRAVAMQAQALEATQAALSSESSRVSGLLEGGFVSPNEAERKAAESASKQAELLATNAKMMRASLEVGDCVLRAPFDGEVAERSMDPGAFARPGAAIATLVDRATVRVVVDVPEGDFEVVAPQTPVKLRVLATGAELGGRVARRSPAADAATRTVHAEIDLANAEHQIPVGTTADVSIEVGQPVPATEIPLNAASVRGKKATLFAIDGDAARKLTAAVLGERGGSLFVDGTLKPGARVVVEGRSLLKDGDRVRARLEGSK